MLAMTILSHDWPPTWPLRSIHIMYIWINMCIYYVQRERGLKAMKITALQIVTTRKQIWKCDGFGQYQQAPLRFFYFRQCLLYFVLASRFTFFNKKQIYFFSQISDQHFWFFFFALFFWCFDFCWSLLVLAILLDAPK